MAKSKIVLISTDEAIVGMGVKTLSSCLIKGGLDTAVVLMPTFRENYKNFCWKDLEEICKYACLVGISCMTHGVQKAIEVKQAIEKKILAPIMIGGIHASLDSESLLNNFNLVCHGEGEDLIVELANRLINNMPYCDIPGLWIKRDSNIIRNPSCPLKRDLDGYPFPDYDLSHQFILEGEQLVPMKPVQGHILFDDFVVLGSRGCPHHCTYCSNQKIKDEFSWRKQVRHYSVNHLINHLKEVCKIYPQVKGFWIEDDTFFIKELEEIADFSQRYEKEINKPFFVLVSPWTFSEDKLKLLIDAGMNKMIMGIQSGSENTNYNIYERNISNERIMEIAQTLHKYSYIKICYDFIGMNPFEKEADLIDTIRLIKKFPHPFFIYNNNLAFYPGAKLYEQALKAGIDVNMRIKHSGSTIGYSILKNENIQHKIFHFILLFIAGDANSFRIGFMPRFLLSDFFIAFYSFLNRRLTLLTNFIINTISFFVLNKSLRRIIKNYFIYGILSRLKSLYLRIR